MIEAKNSKLIVVLGMHRSGTSAITRGLQVMGVELGDRLLPTMEEVNAKGFWEDLDLNTLNIEILGALNSNWYHLAPIEPGDVEALRKMGYFLRAVELLRQKVSSAPIFGFKDPRVAKLLPFWKGVFSHCQFDVRYVLAIRHPLSVVKSLAKRDGFEAAQSYLLWLGHVIASLTNSAGDKRVLVDYDRLIQSPDRELIRIAKCAGLEIDPAELQSYKTGFLDQGLQHTVYEMNDLLLDDTCPAVVREVYAVLLDVASDKVRFDDAELQNKIVHWSDELERLKSPLLLADKLFVQKAIAMQAVAERDGQITSLNQAVAERNGQITSLNQAVAERGGQITSLKQTAAERDGQIASLNQAVAERNGQITSLKQAAAERDGQITSLNQTMSERDWQIAALYSSRSWRFTAPLRWFGKQIIRAKLIRRALSLANWHTGGARYSISKAIRVYRREGLQGVRARIRFLLERDSLARSNIEVSPQMVCRSSPWHGSKEVLPHQQSVDIIVCVHNALDDVRRCLDSVLRNTHPPYELIIVDDGSEKETKEFLEQFVLGQPATLIRNDSATGYTRAANTGMRASTGDFVLLLNSDTIVPPRWLDRLIQCADSDDRIGMVGPLSNTASWQSVPQITNNSGDWAENPLPDSWSVNDYANEVARVSPKIYPRVGFLNGFCLLIRRALINDIGLFDEEIFAHGYGEENDYCLRATQSQHQWQLAIADDCYVFHAQSKSYSHKRRVELSRLAGEALANKHGHARIEQNLSMTRSHPALQYMRRRCESIEEHLNIRTEALRRFEGKRVLFLLPAETCGGGSNIVLLEAATMREFGVDACIANLEIHRSLFEQQNPDIGLPVLYLQKPADLSIVARDFDAVIATLYLTVFWMEPLKSSTHGQGPVLGYYVQDFEPDFFDEGSAENRKALASYTAIPGLRLFTKTIWNREMLDRRLGVRSVVIGPSVDMDSHYPLPAPKTNNGTIKLLAMVRPHSPRRAPEATMRLLKRLVQHFGERVDVTIFGVAPYNQEFLNYPRDFPHRFLGELDVEGVSVALSNADIFIDCSTFQAMGLTAMEAMASGVAVVGPKNGGLREIIEHGHNGLLVDTNDEDVIFSAVSQLVVDGNLRERTQTNAFNVLSHSPVLSSFNILDCLFPQTPKDDDIDTCLKGDT